MAVTRCVTLPAIALRLLRLLPPLLLLPLLLPPSQGIKFYDPEIAEATPEAVEYRGLNNLVEALTERLGLEDGKVGFRMDKGFKRSFQGVCKP